MKYVTFEEALRKNIQAAAQDRNAAPNAMRLTLEEAAPRVRVARGFFLLYSRFLLTTNGHQHPGHVAAEGPVEVLSLRWHIFTRGGQTCV